MAIKPQLCKGIDVCVCVCVARVYICMCVFVCMCCQHTQQVGKSSENLLTHKIFDVGVFLWFSQPTFFPALAKRIASDVCLGTLSTKSLLITLTLSVSYACSLLLSVMLSLFPSLSLSFFLLSALALTFYFSSYLQLFMSAAVVQILFNILCI